MAEPPAVNQPAEQPAAPPAEFQAPEPEAPAPVPAKTVERPKITPRKPRSERAAEPRQEAPSSEPEPVVVPPAPSRRADGSGSGAPADGSRDSARNTPVTPPPPPKPTTATLPEGTVIDIRLDQQISSAVNQPGDAFNALLDRDLQVDGELLAPKGSRVIGKITEVEGSGKVKGRAHMSIVLSALQVGEERYSIESNAINFEAEDSKSRDAKTIGGGAAVGAIIGAIAGGKKGAAIGAAVGGGAGTAGVLLTKGKEVEFQPEQKFSFRLEEDVDMKIR